MRTAKQVIDVFLQPGEYFVGDARYRIRTLLGSCVSIILWHPSKRIGASSHFLLSRRGAGPVLELDARYGDEAMCLMLRELEGWDVIPAECQGKIFGGANMFPQQMKDGMTNVGVCNGESARHLLRSHGIPRVAETCSVWATGRLFLM